MCFLMLRFPPIKKKKKLQKHRCNDPQREKKKERELGLLLPLPCNVTGARRFVHWDGAKSSESDMSNHAVGLLDLHGGCVPCQIMQSVFWIYMVGVSPVKSCSRSFGFTWWVCPPPPPPPTHTHTRYLLAL